MPGTTFPSALCPADAVGGDGRQHRAGAGGAHQEPPVRRGHRLLRVRHGAARQPAGRAAPEPDSRREGQRRTQPKQGESHGTFLVRACHLAPRSTFTALQQGGFCARGLRRVISPFVISRSKWNCYIALKVPGVSSCGRKHELWAL